MPTATDVHIDTLYTKIDELSQDCETHHKQNLAATQEVHRRIDDFTKIMIQMSEINKDVQAMTSHQKAMEIEQKDLVRRMSTVETQSSSNAEVASWVKRGFGAVLMTVLLAVLALLGLKG